MEEAREIKPPFSFMREADKFADFRPKVLRTEETVDQKESVDLEEEIYESEGQAPEEEVEVETDPKDSSAPELVESSDLRTEGAPVKIVPVEKDNTPARTADPGPPISV